MFGLPQVTTCCTPILVIYIFSLPDSAFEAFLRGSCALQIAFSLYNYQLKSLDFVINRFFMKLFRTSIYM